MKQALGLAVSGTEVRLAHLVSHKGQIRIEGLERARLKTTLEHQPAPEEKPQYADAEDKEAFDLKDAVGDKDHGTGAYKQDGANLESLYQLLEKYTRKKVKIAFNIPLSMVNYQRMDGPFAIAIGGSDKEIGQNLGQKQLKSKDGSSISMSYEKHPPTMSLLQEVNGFVRNNLYFALMDTTELALANLARSSLKLEVGKITTIIYIEDDFTRLIFLRGQDLLHVSSIIHENTASPENLEVIYRKLLYEQDEAQIPEISTILLAGKSSRINAREFFTSLFENVTVEYLASQKLGSFPANDSQRRTFSEFAVPIALAWKVLEPKNPAFIPLNLLPQELLDQQQVLKLDYRGYILLALTGLMAFFFTWQILKIRSNINTMRTKNIQLEQQIKNNQATVDKVLGLEDQIKRLTKNFVLADSLSLGHNEFLAFLQKLNASVGRTRNLWVDEIVKQKEGFSIKGSAFNRESIPMLAEKLEQASLRRVSRMEANKRKLFNFELERYSTPDNIQLAGQGISTFDAQNYGANGNLILTGEGVRPASRLSPNESLARSPAASGLEEPMSRQPLWTDQKPKANDGAGSNPATTKPVVKPASITPPLRDQSQADGRSESVREKPVPEKRPPELPRRFDSPVIETKKTSAPADPDVQMRDGYGTTVPTNKVAAPPETRQLAGSNEAGRPEFVANNIAAPRNSPVQPDNATSSPPAVKAQEIYRAYSIEAAVSYTKELAEQLAAAYRKQGYDAAVDYYQDERSGTRRYRVLVGAFSTRPAAEKKAAQMAGLLTKDYRIVGLK
ncbi:MAG: SPOR domain-containing protein [candidate division KSB1 bacterium]|nr:SPOR domain-containing protein [candidate division KSB1 bacterium]MDZ7309835.1 SPOR domain-containing protein [candidate division KSB1 bacterium]